MNGILVRPSDCIRGVDFPCQDVNTQADMERVIPGGATYKIHGPEYWFGDVHAFPSYLQAGPSFFIEKSKRRMIAEDIASAMSLVL